MEKPIEINYEPLRKILKIARNYANKTSAEESIILKKLAKQIKQRLPKSNFYYLTKGVGFYSPSSHKGRIEPAPSLEEIEKRLR